MQYVCFGVHSYLTDFSRIAYDLKGKILELGKKLFRGHDPIQI